VNEGIGYSYRTWVRNPPPPLQRDFGPSFFLFKDRYIPKEKYYRIMKNVKSFEEFVNESLNEKQSLLNWFVKNIDSFKNKNEYMKAGQKAGFSKKELQDIADDFEQGGDDYI